MKSMTHDTRTDSCIDVCNELLRGELSAVETYDQTIRKFENDPAAASLRQIRDEHLRASQLLRGHVVEMGGTPSTDSGAWGAFVKTVQGVAKAFGESSALSGLRQGEEHGLKQYRQALESTEVMTECKELILGELLPRTERHIASLHNLARGR